MIVIMMVLMLMRTMIMMIRRKMKPANCFSAGCRADQLQNLHAKQIVVCFEHSHA